jgi:hypothetical protein
MNSVRLSFPRLLKLFIYIFLLLQLACAEKIEYRIPEPKFIDLYAHLLILDEIKEDSIRLSYQERFLSHEGFSMVQIDSTLIYYKRNPDLWPEVMRQIRDRIKELRAHPLVSDSLENG